VTLGAQTLEASLQRFPSVRFLQMARHWPRKKIAVTRKDLPLPWVSACELATSLPGSWG